MKAYPFLLVAVIGFNSASQLFFKSIFAGGSLNPGWLQVRTYLADARLWVGVGSQIIATMCWFALLTRAPLNVALPLYTGVMFALVAVLSWWLFGERLASAQMAGIGAVAIGIWLLAGTKM